MRSRFGLRAVASRNGRLLRRILHRLGEVLTSGLQRVLCRDRPDAPKIQEQVEARAFGRFAG